MTFGTGIPLRQLSPTLRNKERRHAIILHTVEVDSIIEGLPPFTEKTRKECLEEIKNVSSRL